MLAEHALLDQGAAHAAPALAMAGGNDFDPFKD